MIEKVDKGVYEDGRIWKKRELEEGEEELTKEKGEISRGK